MIPFEREREREKRKEKKNRKKQLSTRVEPAVMLVSVPLPARLWKSRFVSILSPQGMYTSPETKLLPVVVRIRRLKGCEQRLLQTFVVFPH